MKKGLLLLPVIFAMCFHSCKDAIPEIELENFMYLSLTGARNNPNIKKLDLANTQDTLFNVTLSYGGTNNYRQGDIEATIETDFTLVNQFNIDHRTEYLPLPAETYSFNSNKAVITDGSSSSAPLKLTLKMSALNLSNEYLLPVTVKSVSGSNLPLHEEYKTLYLVFMADIDEEVGKDRWTSGGASSIWEQCGVENVFDGENSTYWQSGMGGLPQWLMVDMEGYKRIDGFLLKNKNDVVTDALPKHIKVETSLNKSDWQTVLDIAELPQEKGRQTLPLAQTTVARYFRITILSTWGDTNYSNLAEIGIYAGEAPDAGIERDIWSIIDFSSEWNDTSYGVKNVLDDEIGTVWHSDPFNAATNGMPQWFTVDMNKTQRISGFIFANRQDDLSASPTRIRFEVSSDGLTWSTALIVDDIPNIFDMQTFPCDSPVMARYFKLIIETNYAGAPWSHVAHISIY